MKSNIIELDDDVPGSCQPYRPLFKISSASLDATQEETSWINDEAMHAILQLFMHSNPREVTVTDSLWLDASTPEEAGAHRRRMERYWEGQQSIMMPMCVDRHWLLAVIRESRDLIQIYDSRPGIPADLRERKNKAINLLGGLLPNNSVATAALERAVVTCPILQLNDYDCGTIVLIIAFYVTIGLSPPQSEANTPPWRRLFAEFLRPLSDEEEQLIASDDKRLVTRRGKLHADVQPPPWLEMKITGARVSVDSVLAYSEHLISSVQGSIDQASDIFEGLEDSCGVAPTLELLTILRDKAIALGSLEAAVRIQRVVRSMEEADEARELKEFLIGYVNRASAFLSAH